MTETLRTVDELGRINLPKAALEALGIFEGDKLEVLVNENYIKLVRKTLTCCACNADNDVKKVNKTFLCGECREAIRKFC